MTKRESKWLRIIAIIILFPMVLATLGTLLSLPNAIRALRAGPKAAVDAEK